MLQNHQVNIYNFFFPSIGLDSIEDVVNNCFTCINASSHNGVHAKAFIFLKDFEKTSKFVGD